MRSAGWLSLPAAFYCLAFFAVPLALLLIESVQGPQGLTLAYYAEFFGSAFAWGVLVRTLWLALATTALCLLIAYPAAFALAWARGWLQSVLVAALLLPLSLSVIVKAFGWTVLLRGNGLINSTLQALHLTDAPLRLLFTPAGLLIGMVNIFLPFMVLPIFASVAQLDARLTDAASTLGGGPAYVFRRVVLPLTWPGILAGITLVFSLSIAAYVIPTLLMGDAFQTLPTTVATSFLYLQDPHRGAVAGVLLLVLAVGVVLASSALGRRTEVA